MKLLEKFDRKRDDLQMGETQVSGRKELSAGIVGNEWSSRGIFALSPWQSHDGERY
jgi:hypothetical protein